MSIFLSPQFVGTIVCRCWQFFAVFTLMQKSLGSFMVDSVRKKTGALSVKRCFSCKF